jgi:O-antigen ligase
VLAILGGIFPNAFSQILKIAPPRIIGGSPFPFYRSSGRVMNWGINDCFLLYGIIVVGLSLFHSKILKMNSNLKYLILLILFFAIMIGQTRTSLISLQAAIISAYLLTNINRNKKRIIVAFVITIFITFAFIEYYNELSDIFLSFGTSGMEKRLNSFSLAIRCFLQNPFAGIGYNEFLNKMRVQYYLAGLFTRDIDKMHNLYLFILVGGGLISFIPYLFLIILILKIIVQKIRKTATPEIRYILTVILSTLIGLFIEIAMIPAAGLKLMWMLMGLGVSCGLLSETSRTSFALNITDHKYQLKHNRFQKLKLFGIK